MKPTLVILAAGMGSRYGGLKQIDPVGPAGETILDYSVFDAKRAGFGKVVFIIRKDIEKDFTDIFINRLQQHIDIEWVFQEITNLPEGFSAPPERQKPWGTGHAVMMAENKVNEPFAVINADDFYGFEAFTTIVDYLNKLPKDSENKYAMVAYEIQNTLSDFGSVSRGICIPDESGFLTEVTEVTQIERIKQHIGYTDAKGVQQHLKDNTPVSMNFWGFTPDFFAHLEKQFKEFLSLNISNPKSEFYIPFVVDNLIKQRISDVAVLNNPGQWFGITYKEDKPEVISSIKALITKGVYPSDLWNSE